MLSKLLISALFSLCILYQSSQAQRLKIQDNKGREIQDASLVINGQKLSFNEVESLSLDAYCSEGLVHLKIRHVSFALLDTNIQCDLTGTIVLSLTPLDLELDEFIIRRRTTQTQSHFGYIDIPQKSSLERISLFGTPDPIKYLQTLPGISTSLEGSNLLFIRGGSSDQSQVLFDGGVLANYNHLFGLLSAVNPYFIGNMRLHKGAVPVSFGGAGSGYVEMESPDPDTAARCTAEIGLIYSGLSYQSKQHKRWSFGAAARITYADKVINFFDEFESGFHDYHFTASYALNKGNLKYSFYRSMDRYDFEGAAVIPNDINASDFKWFTNLHSLQLSRPIDDRTNLHSTLSYSALNSNMSDLASVIQRDQSNKVLLWNTRWSQKREKLLIEAGKDIRFYSLSATQTELLTHPAFNATAVSISPYVATSLPLRNWNLYAGLRANLYAHNSQWNQIFFNPEPRINLKRAFPKLELMLAYDRMAQYSWQFSNNLLPIGFLFPLLSNDNLPPLLSNQYSAEAKWTQWNKLKLHGAAYYKSYQSFSDLVDFGQIRMLADPYQELTETRLWTYGFELMAQYRINENFDLQASYTYSKSLRQSPEINFGRAYNSEYDRPHMFFGHLQFTSSNKKWNVVNGITAQSNRPVTMPISTTRAGLTIFSDRNDFRLPHYFRWDLSFKYTRKPDKKKWQSVWNVSIYNLTNRMNVFGVYVDSPDNSIELVPVYMTLFPILPLFSYQLNIR
jgi:hypothetical protein